MAHLIEVAFKGNRKDFFIWEQDDLPPVKAPVVVEADRGEDIGQVHAVGDLAAKRNAGASHGYGAGLPARRARRLASNEEIARLRELRSQDEEARQRAMDRVKANGLVMKVSDAEWQWDRKKLTFYFSAEKRVDFRNLVRELASTFRTRIELKQIGVRDEAKRLDGMGRCGRRYCSASWLPELLPVNLGVAKDQRLSLNPTQISGACGRLMCCLRYEHDFYVQSRKRFPKETRILTTSRGEEKVLANDIFRERVTLRGPDGETRIVPLAELRDEVAQTEPDAAWLRAAPPDAGDARTGASARPSSATPPPHRALHVVTPPPAAPSPSPALESAAPAASDPQPVDAAGEEATRRPHRRRGRRGGRRNRGGSRPNHESDEGTGPDNSGTEGAPQDSPAAPPTTGA
ncbi:MAG: PSP1 domain-containing protein [Gemmatimonadaceae bacterium]